MIHIQVNNKKDLVGYEPSTTMKGKTTKYETHLSKRPKVSVVLGVQSQDKFGKCSEVDDARLFQII